MAMRLLLFIITLFSLQTVIAQQGTSLEEYRYLSKGYAYQIDLGLDATKEGYSFRPVYDASNALEFIGMYRTGQQTPRALLCVFPGRANSTYLCLPNRDSEQQIKDMYQQDRTRLSQGQLRMLETALVELVYAEMGNPNQPLVQAPVVQTPSSYGQEEVFTARGGNPEPLVATANSAPRYPGQSPLTKDTRPPSYSNTNTTSTPINQTVARAIPAEPVNTNTTTAPANASPTQLQLNFQLDDRAVRYQAPLVTNTRKKGVIVIKLCVDASGEVTTSKFTQRGSTTFDSSLISLALENAASLRFEANALPEQCGTISYRFNL